MSQGFENKIDVLLATYCPKERMLCEQIDSIRAQKGVDINLICREDIEGLGACANFAKLLESSTAEYVAFSDQDDVWLENKLAKSMERMRKLETEYGKDTPLLVFTDAKVVDPDLNILDESLFHRTKINPQRLRPEQLIQQNVANGNTMLFNAALARKATSIPREAFMHDHWVILVASVFGKIACIDEPTLLYRQHEGNVIGGAKVGIEYYLRRLRQGVRQLRKRLYKNIIQAEAFALRYPDAPACFKACIGFEKRNWFARRWLLLRHGIFKNGLLRNIGVFLLI